MYTSCASREVMKSMMLALKYNVCMDLGKPWFHNGVEGSSFDHLE